MTVRQVEGVRGNFPKHEPFLSAPEGGADTSQAASDTFLAKAYAAQLSSGSRLQIPPASTLGRWLEVLKLLFESPVVKRMLETGSVTAISVDPVQDQISIQYTGKLIEESIILTDIPGGSDIFESLMVAAKALTPYGVLNLPAYFKDGTVALSDVQHFYGEPTHLTPEQKSARSKELAHRPVFQGQGSLPDNALLFDALRGTGNAYTLHNLLAGLKAQIDKPGVNVDLDAIEVEVAAHSDLWSEQAKQPVKISLKELLIEYGLHVPATRDELVNLERALCAPPLRAGNEEDYGGLLSKDVPLSGDAQETITKTVGVWKTLQTQLPPDEHGRAPSLLDYLQRVLPESVRALASKAPQAFLNALINTPQALALGEQLQVAIDAPATKGSAQQALLTALVLEADPAAGQVRNNLAGYDLRQQANWGLSAAEIVRRFEQHLEARVGPQMAKVVAYQLLAMSAPEFLVKDLPPSLVYGSQQWASLSAAVSRREQDTSGSCAGQTYAAIMRHDVLNPITEVGQTQLQLAAMRSATDWGIANGVIEQRSDDKYSPETIDKAVVALKNQVDGLVESAAALAAPVPTRRELALAELRRVYGVEMESFFEDRTLLGNLPPGSRKRFTYSLLDIYMTGDLHKHKWSSSSEHFSTATIQAGFSKLPDIKAVFEERFDTYTDNVKKASETHFQYLFSQLPVEDRQLIERGKVTTFSLAAPSKHRGSVSADHAISPYWRDGAILIRAELDGKVCHYLYSPSNGKIIKDADPTRPGLKSPLSRLYFSMERPGHPGEKEAPVTILWQALGTRWPSKDKIDFAALSIYPSRSLATPLPGHSPATRSDVPSARLKELRGVVSAFYSRGVESAKAVANGETSQERSARLQKEAMSFVLSLIPFYDAINSFSKGNPTQGLLYSILDVFGLILPAIKGGSLAIKAGSKGMGSALGFLKGFTKAGTKAINPLGGLYDVGHGVFRLGRSGFKQLSHTKLSLFDKLRHGRGRSGSFDIPKPGRKEPIAEGVYRSSGAKTASSPVMAVQRNGKWYAYDQKNMVPYGAPLKGFTPNAASGRHQLVMATAMNSTIEVASGMVAQHIRPPAVAYQFQPPRSLVQIDLEQQAAIDRIVDQTIAARATKLRLEIQLADKQFAVLAGTEAQATDLEARAGDILESLDQMEAALESLEERVADEAQACRVFFERYLSAPIDSVSATAGRDRLNAIEKRLAEVSNALLDIKTARPEVA